MTLQARWISGGKQTALCQTTLPIDENCLAVCTVVDKLSVVMVAVFGVVFLGEKLSGGNWLGIVFIGLGVVLLTLK